MVDTIVVGTISFIEKNSNTPRYIIEYAGSTPALGTKFGYLKYYLYICI